jgi:hypothetical protein
MPISESGKAITEKIIPKLAILSWAFTIVILPLQKTKNIKIFG